MNTVVIDLELTDLNFGVYRFLTGHPGVDGCNIWFSEGVIFDQQNILQATLLAMRRAVARLPEPPTLALVDGNQNPGLGLRTELVIKGDARVPEISAASIVAKVVRDRLMVRLARRYPHYGWERNAGKRKWCMWLVN